MTQQLNADNSIEQTKVRTLDFKSNSIETLTLEELKQTYPEKSIEGIPSYNGIFHFDLIERIAETIKRNGLDYNVETIFAADNTRKGANGVAVNPEIELIHGKSAIQAHALRRVFTTIRINDMEDEETNTGLAIAFHQDGIQIAIGPNVKICSNQCILSANRSVSTYGGEHKIKSIDKIMDIIDDWMKNFGEQRTHDQKIISKMKTIPTTYQNVMELIGRLTTIRVVKDSKEKVLKNNEANLGKSYPLNATQINAFTEKYLLKCVELGTTDMSLWDVYNISTTLYKPGLTDLPNLVSQNIAWSEFLVKEFNL